MHSIDIYELGGRFLHVNNSDESVALSGRSFFQEFYLRSVSVPESTTADCTIDLKSEDPPSIPRGLREFGIQRGVCFSDGRRIILRVDGSQIQVEPVSPGRVTVWFGQSNHAKHRIAVINVLSYALPAALRRCGLYEVHSAGLIEPTTGAGFLLIGDSNTGKSSLSIRLISSGWKYLTDDMLVVKDNGSAVEALALRRLFSIEPSSISVAGLTEINSALGTPVNSNRNKRRLEPDDVFPGRFEAVNTPRVLCFLSIAKTKESAVKIISHSDAMVRMIKHCAWSSYDETGAAGFLKVLGRLVGQSNCFELSAGSDFLDDRTLVAELLASLAPSEPSEVLVN